MTKKIECSNCKKCVLNNMIYGGNCYGGVLYPTPEECDEYDPID